MGFLNGFLSMLLLWLVHPGYTAWLDRLDRSWMFHGHAFRPPTYVNRLAGLVALGVGPLLGAAGAVLGGLLDGHWGRR